MLHWKLWSCSANKHFSTMLQCLWGNMNIWCLKTFFFLNHLTITTQWMTQWRTYCAWYVIHVDAFIDQTYSILTFFKYGVKYININDLSLYFSPVIQRVLPAVEHCWRGKETLGKNAILIFGFSFYRSFCKCMNKREEEHMPAWC